MVLQFSNIINIFIILLCDFDYIKYQYSTSLSYLFVINLQQQSNRIRSGMNQKTVFILVALLIIFGAINTIQLKLQNIHILNRQTGQKFFHPFTQTILLFIGQACVGFIYFFHKMRENRQRQILENNPKLLEPEQEGVLKLKAPFMKAFWPAVFDLLATLFSYLALNTVDSSVWQMSKGGVIVTTAILSRIMLKRVFSNRAILGCSLAFIGITSVQVVAVLATKSQSTVTMAGQLIGLGLLFVSILFNSFGLIIQKKVFDKYQFHPLKMVFAQGIIGVILMSIITFGFQYVPCPWLNKKQCVCISVDQCYLQNYSKYFFDLGSSTMLILLTFGFICSIAISVPIGAFLSKQVSPISRSLANVSRTLFIWLFNIIMTATIGQSQAQYKLQSLRVDLNIYKGLGFATLMIGTFLYHQKKKDLPSKDELSETVDPLIQLNVDFNQQDIVSLKSQKSKSEADTNFDSEDFKNQEEQQEASRETLKIN